MSIENTEENTAEGVEELPLLNEEQNETMAKMEMEQNLPLALLGGVLAAVLGAAIWASITVITGYQIGFMAIGVGFLVGYAVRIFGKGIKPIFGVIGATFALFGCILGNIFTMAYFGSVELGMSFFEFLTVLEIAVIPELLVETFQPMDLLFYGFAIYEGFKFSFKA